MAALYKYKESCAMVIFVQLGTNSVILFPKCSEMMPDFQKNYRRHLSKRLFINF